MKFWESGKLHERMNIGLTGIIAFLTAINVLATILYFCTVRKAYNEASVQTDKIIAAANVQSGAASRIAESANQFSTTAGQIRTDTTNAVDQFTRLAKSSEDSLKAAQNSSQKALDASIQASTLDERPWVIFSNFSLSAEAQEGKDYTIVVKIGLGNTGKTPALDVYPVSKVSNWFRDQRPPAMEQSTLTPVSQGLIAPGSTSAQNSFKTAPLTIPPTHTAAYVAGQTLIYVRARIIYRDLNDINHWTTLCISHRYGAPLDEFEYCSEGNDADNNKK